MKVLKIPYLKSNKSKKNDLSFGCLTGGLLRILRKMGIKAVFGANLKYYRKKRRFSQEELSEKAGISARHLSFIENGAAFVSAELLEKLTEILKVSASALFYDQKEISWDDTLMTSIDRLVETEMVNTVESIKLQLRYLSGL